MSSFSKIPFYIFSRYFGKYLTIREAACLVYASTGLLGNCKVLLKNNRETEIRKIASEKIGCVNQHTFMTPSKEELIVNLLEYVYKNMDVLFLDKKFKEAILYKLCEMNVFSTDCLKLLSIKYFIKFEVYNAQYTTYNVNISFITKNDREMVLVTRTGVSNFKFEKFYDKKTIMS